ncbi:Cas10/Cmr2 second palm domain-containing protein [Planktothrix agardhii]|uniref:Cas10/Cmr2 second palm domain-containing protein n=1 Tax=Planktothrix agardhii TaxID=1160 RepID=UPI001D0B4483|nr:type III-B CRISPR-associated protein Cas10/Cmr2 [Planktothrix agardhii]MCB8762132.1 CRISPR-associated protein Cmr2 [Planktothrix agardhii 1813]
MTEGFTAVSFAPVQGFIEKSRKLRDLYGASLILSYLSSRIVQEALCLGLDVISPGLPNVQKGMPNRILIKGKFERNDVQNILLKEWQRILTICRDWIEDNLGIPKDQYCWSQSEDQIGKHKGEWERWGSHTWEIFWGYGASIPDAMEDLETRKLKRDWTGINWIGESSSLTGTDAIAWHQLGKESNQPGRSLNETEERELKRFYYRLAWILDDPYSRNHKVRDALPSDEELKEYFQLKTSGKFIAPGEKLSIPELVKRLVTLPKLAKDIGMETLDEGFKEINRDAGYWTGWFMGDGDEVGDKLQLLATQSEDHMRKFTNKMREWGKDFEKKQNLFPEGKGRVIYAGGDDFLGVLYSEQTDQNLTSNKLNRMEVLNWLLTLPEHWQELQTTLDELQLKFTFSVGFVWAGHSVPQRDILQHCREAEKLAKNSGRDRLTIRVVFNSGQHIQWTCPWKDLDILKKYRDRNGKTWGENPNWTHIYNDWEQLKARHAIICLRGASKQSLGEISKKTINKDMALALFNLYFDEAGKRFKEGKKWNEITKNNTDIEILSWLNDLVQVGWQLCHNSNI